MSLSSGDWFTPAEAAAWLGVGKTMILRACRLGQLRHARYSHRTIRIHREWLLGWADERTTPESSDNGGAQRSNL